MERVEKASRESSCSLPPCSRPLPLQGCATDTSRVPYRVQAILGLAAPKNTTLSHLQMQQLEDAVANSVDVNTVNPGDVRVVTSGPWQALR